MLEKNDFFFHFDCFLLAGWPFLIFCGNIFSCCLLLFMIKMEK